MDAAADNKGRVTKDNTGLMLTSTKSLHIVIIINIPLS